MASMLAAVVWITFGSALAAVEPLNFGFLQFAAKVPFQDGEIHGITIMCNKGACYLTLTRVSAGACTGATPKIPAQMASEDFSNEKAGNDNLLIRQLSPDSLLIEFTRMLPAIVVKTTLVVSYRRNDPKTGIYYAYAPATTISGSAVATDLATKSVRTYEYSLIPGPVTCEIELSHYGN